MAEAKVPIWDLPVRMFHWLLVPLIAFSWWSAEDGRLEWHRISGYAVLALVVFRLAWGVVGSDTAQFHRFLKGPRDVGAYMSGKSQEPALGHNPLGGWSVLAMLVLMTVQSALGLFAVDVDGIESGPLAVFVSFDQGRLAAEAHHLAFNLLLTLIGLHVSAIAYYAFVKKSNLVGPMITGRKSMSSPPEHAPRRSPRWLALFIVIACAGLTYAVSRAFWVN